MRREWLAICEWSATRGRCYAAGLQDYANGSPVCTFRQLFVTMRDRIDDGATSDPARFDQAAIRP
jgi:hypothetical protein